MRSGVYAPIGDHGAVLAGSDEVGAFDERTRQLLELLAANAEAAFDRVERERALEESERRYRTLAEHFPDGSVGVFDHDLRYSLVEGAIWDDIGPDADQLEGRTAGEALPPETAADLEPLFRAALEEGAIDSVVTEFADRIFRVWAMPIRDSEGEIFSGLSFSVDITERVERERELERSERRYRTLVENVPNGAVALVDEDLRYRTAGGRPVDAEADTGGDLEGTPIREAISTELADVLEPRYRAALDGESNTFEYEHDGKHSWFHIFPVRDDDGEVFAAMGMSQDVTDRIERERELERQRERLAALQDVNAAVREISEAVVEQSTREAIEEAVCRRLANSESYELAWVGELTPGEEEVVPRTGAGAEGYLDDITLSVDPDRPAGQGPTGRAFRTGEMQVVSDVRTDPDYEPWRERARESGFRSAAAIPITYQESVYGVLNVYADRAGAFEGEERAAVGGIGEVIGHAINAIERRRALVSDEVVELEFLMPDLYGSLDVPAADGTVTFERVVRVEEGRFAVYGTTTDDGVDLLSSVRDALDSWENLAVVDETAGEMRFRLTLSEPPATSIVAEQGGRVHRAEIEDGQFRLVVHLPVGEDVRTVVDAIQDAYPDLEMVAQRQTTRKRRTATGDELLASALTDRQRQIIEAAFAAGFFEWPRESSGEDLAETFDIAPSTFHQHIRKAQQKLLTGIFEGE